MSLIHGIKKVILRNSRFLSVINTSQDNILNDKLDKTDGYFGGQSGQSEAVIPTSSNAIVQAWLDKITLEGYAYPTQAKVDVYTTAWDYADAQGITTELDLFGLLKVANQNLCKIPFIHSGGAAKRFTLVDNPIFTANKGLKGNSGSGYLKTSWIESVNGVKYALGNCCIGGGVVDYTSDSFSTLIGSDVSGLQNELIPYFFAGLFGSLQNDNSLSGTTVIGSGVTTPVGNSVLNYRLGLGKAYKNGVQDGVDSTENGPAVSKSTIEDYVLNSNGDGSLKYPSYDGDVTHFFKGSGSIDQAKLNTFVTMLLT